MRASYSCELTATFGLDPEERFERGKRYTKGVNYLVDTVIVTEQFPAREGHLGPLISLRGQRIVRDGLGTRVNEDWLRESEVMLPIALREQIATRLTEWQRALSTPALVVSGLPENGQGENA